MNRIAVRIIVLIALCAMAFMSACSNATNTGTTTTGRTDSAATRVELNNCALIKDASFGGVYLDISINDFNALGFTFGDGIDVTFSNGYTLKNIPYYNGYYAKTGEPLACGYPGYEHVLLNNAQGPSLWTQAGVSEGDSATVVLVDPGKYLNVQEALSLSYSSERSDYTDDITFANFRELSGGMLKEGLLYRSASPIDDTYNRVTSVNCLAKNAGVLFVLDLADNSEEITNLASVDQQKGADASYFLELNGRGNVAPHNIGSDYMSASCSATLVDDLRELTTHEGPYLVHCLEGKDRTGFVCMLLESLAGATYDELCNDYMITYANYYGVTKKSDPERYDTIVDIKFDDMLANLTHAEKDADLKAMNYAESARRYLRDGGMTDNEIERLLEVICR